MRHRYWKGQLPHSQHARITRKVDAGRHELEQTEGYLRGGEPEINCRTPFTCGDAYVSRNLSDAKRVPGNVYHSTKDNNLRVVHDL